jgi:predicted RNase H-like nuclease (RuvC/YqgF family)
MPYKREIIIDYKNQRQLYYTMLLLSVFVIWGCVPELTKDCIDMTNTSSTYLSIIIGAAIGVVISWWIYDRQKKTSVQQDYILQRVRDLEQKNTNVLMNLENFAERHDELLNRLILLNENILELDKKIQSLMENK